MAAAARVGGAALGLAVVAFSREPQLALAVLGIVLTVVGGTTWRATCPIPLRVACLLATIVVARLTLGTAGAALATVLVALGAFLRIRPADAVTGLAAFGGVVACLSGTSLGLVLFFWSIGLALVLLRPLASRISRQMLRGWSLTVEKANMVHLGPEN